MAAKTVKNAIQNPEMTGAHKSGKGQRVGYVRVSSFEQNVKRQLEGMDIDRYSTDMRDGDTAVVHSMDRLARNLDGLCRLVQTLTGKGVSIEFVHEHLTFTGADSPMATLMLSVIGVFAEFEWSVACPVCLALSQKRCHVSLRHHLQFHIRFLGQRPFRA